MILTLTRDVFAASSTLGRLDVTYDGANAYAANGWRASNPRGPLPFGFVVEDLDRGLDQHMAAAEIVRRKVAAQTAIPAGEYRLILTRSERFGHLTPDGRMMLVADVPGFAGIRVHPGNTPADTAGCLLPGLKRADGKVLDSTVAWRWLDARVRDCEARKEPVRLRIVRDVAAWAAFQGGP